MNSAMAIAWSFTRSELSNNSLRERPISSARRVPVDVALPRGLSVAGIRRVTFRFAPVLLLVTGRPVVASP
jgi:hypothetical protein